jgi:hypothetical protein
MQVSNTPMMSQEITPLIEGQIRVNLGAVHQGVQAMSLVITAPGKTKVTVLVGPVCIKHNTLQ